MMPSEPHEENDQTNTPPDNGVPEVEDAYAPPSDVSDTPPDDEPAVLDEAARSLDDETIGAEDTEDSGVTTTPTIDEPEAEDAGDTDSIKDEPETPEDAAAAAKPPNWDRELSAHRIAVELKRVEKEIRTLLEGRDSKRKRKLTGTRRWTDLHDDILSWCGTGRIEDEVLARMNELITRRSYLFRRLKFLAGTRRGWNT